MGGCQFWWAVPPTSSTQGVQSEEPRLACGPLKLCLAPREEKAPEAQGRGGGAQDFLDSDWSSEQGPEGRAHVRRPRQRVCEKTGATSSVLLPLVGVDKCWESQSVQSLLVSGWEALGGALEGPLHQVLHLGTPGTGEIRPFKLGLPFPQGACQEGAG